MNRNYVLTQSYHICAAYCNCGVAVSLVSSALICHSALDMVLESIVTAIAIGQGNFGVSIMM